MRITYALGIGRVGLISGEQIRATNSPDLMQAVSGNVRQLLLQGRCKTDRGGLF